MITVLSSAKPASGTSTTAALHAVAVRHNTPTHVVDLCGDQTSLLGLANRPDPAVEVTELTAATVGEQLAVVRRLAALGDTELEIEALR